MAIETPSDWLARVARIDPGRACLVSDERDLTYAELLALVTERAGVLAHGIGRDEIRSVRVALDSRSIVELLAIQRAGGIPLPYLDTPPDVPVATAEGVAVCVATSGTSGTRKIVPLTYASIAVSVKASRERLGNDADDRWLLSLPLNHVGGLSVIWRSLEAGGAIIVAPFEASGSVIERHRPTIASMVPTMVRLLLDQNSLALAAAGLVLVGGAPLRADLWKEATEAGARLIPTYGMTEAGSQVATLAPSDPRVAPGLVGRPLAGFKVSIVGSSGESLPAGEVGRVAIEGEALFSGYLGEARRPTPFVTNDRGFISAEGDLVIEGRSDDVIVSGGENLSLGRVADIIAGFDGVQDVCVVAVDDPLWGTIAGAMVVASNRVLPLDSMASAALKPHERPKRWLVCEEIPTLDNGKHDLAAIKAAFRREPRSAQ
ncbi:MAG: class I adenylate-forming enzyme family protein [Actinomycetota bacterium]|nr:class I adenylate-forming enzyme family protein [Actinomycetota bacterium]